MARYLSPKLGWPDQIFALFKKKRKNRDRYSPGVGGYSGFQVLGMIERFFLGGGV